MRIRKCLADSRKPDALRWWKRPVRKDLQRYDIFSVFFNWGIICMGRRRWSLVVGRWSVLEPEQ